MVASLLDESESKYFHILCLFPLLELPFPQGEFYLDLLADECRKIYSIVRMVGIILKNHKCLSLDAD